LDTDPTGTGEKDVVILGDLNSYAKEDPVKALEAAGYTNLVSSFLGEDAYSYVFDGQWGYLDHALGSADLFGKDQVAGVAEFHINADEPSVLDYNTDFKTAEPPGRALRPGHVPRLRPRPGHRRPHAELPGHRRGSLRRHVGELWCGQCQPHGRHRRPGRRRHPRGEDRLG
jgi:hypothetical protein